MPTILAIDQRTLSTGGLSGNDLSSLCGKVSSLTFGSDAKCIIMTNYPNVIAKELGHKAPILAYLPIRMINQTLLPIDGKREGEQEFTRMICEEHASNDIVGISSNPDFDGNIMMTKLGKLFSRRLGRKNLVIWQEGMTINKLAYKIATVIKETQASSQKEPIKVL